jgi:hypothetical protein
MLDIKIASVLLVATLASFTVGCAADAEPEPVESVARSLTTDYEGVKVVAERDAAGRVRVEPKNARGEAALVMTVEGGTLTIEPGAGATVRPWSGPVPASASAENHLEDWSFVAYAYAEGFSSPGAPSATTGIRPQMAAGTDGQMCIAAGGTAMECAYYLYCRRHWCPLW